MSSNIPTRRLTRATRLPDENAVKGRAPLVRGTTKSGVTAAAAGPSKPTTSAAAIDANLQNKRKREALGEVTNNNKNKIVPKGVSKDGKIAKPHVLINGKPDRPTIKAPARKVRGTSAAASRPAEVLEADDEDGEDADEDAMIIDEPVPPAPTLHRVLRRPTARTSTTAAIPVATRHTKKNSDVGGVTISEHAQTTNVDDDVENDDIHRALKRRRTSSEADVEAAVETEAEADVVPAQEAALTKYESTADATVPQQQDDDEEEEEVTGWEDLDKEDFDDPYMVSEYVVDIFKYLCECEDQTLPNPNYMQHQYEKGLRWHHRGMLMDYLIGIHHRFRMLPETLYLTVNIIDRFLSMRVVSLNKLQLVGLSALFIASKFEEICAPSVANLLAAGVPQDDCKEAEMLQAEKYILRTLNWSVSLYPQPMNWLRRVSKADDYDPEVRSLAKFFLEIHVVEKKLLGVKPSLIAAASIWLGRLVLNHFGWTPNLAHYSGYSEKRIIPVANVMLNYCLRPDQHENFIQKYASKKYNKVGVFIRDWVTSRWTMGDKVSLIDELPYLTALAAEQRD